MTPSEFGTFIRRMREYEETLLNVKRQQYSDADPAENQGDVLQNFRELGEFTGLGAANVALVLTLKHVQSIKKAVVTGEITLGLETEDGFEGLTQRFADARNYLALLLAILEDDDKNSPTSGL